MVFHWQLMAPHGWILHVETRRNGEETSREERRRCMKEKQWRPEIASARSSKFMNSFMLLHKRKIVSKIISLP
jgi:hypothetical protein